MPICIPHLGLAIYTSPKVLSTSLKSLAFQLENGWDFRDFSIAGQWTHIHYFYKARVFEPVNPAEYPHTVAFVRDPVERFLSMFRHRVRTKRAKSRYHWEKAIEAGLPEKPTVRQFIKEFEAYSTLIPEIRHHAAPQTEFLGNQDGYYSQIFNDATVPEFECLIEALSGSRATVPRKQVSTPDPTVAVSKGELRWIRKRYAEDYQVFGSYLPMKK